MAAKKRNDGTASSRPRRWSAGRKAEIVQRLLRGESLDALSRETGQPVSRLAEWRDVFIQAGEQAMKARQDDPEVEAHIEEKRRLQAKLGETMMDNELLREKIERIEAGHPFHLRRSKK